MFSKNFLNNEKKDISFVVETMLDMMEFKHGLGFTCEKKYVEYRKRRIKNQLCREINTIIDKKIEIQKQQSSKDLSKDK